jgi:predicted AlkP superfamily phosphohydrolase/phosphomutase
MKKKVLVLIICASALAAFIFIFQGKNKADPGPVMVIGLDGADWNIINPLIEKGKLPHLHKLIEEGSSGILHTFRPTKSPVIWTSVATGKTMIKHGVLDWAYVKANNVEVPYSVEDRKVKAIWKILSENGFTTGIINWFCTFPAEEVNGYLVSDRFRLSTTENLGEEDFVFPKDLREKILPKVFRLQNKVYTKLIREEGIKDFLSQSKRLKLEIPENREIQLRRFRRYFLQDKSIENIASHLYQNVPVDFFAAYFRLIDTTSHFTSMFLEKELREKWEEENKTHNGPTPGTEKRLYRNMMRIIEPVYVYIDNIVGRLLEKTSENTTVIVVSDHGFNFSPIGYNHYNTPTIPHGIIIMKGPGIIPGGVLHKAKIYDIAPTILHHFNLPLGKDMDGSVIEEAYADKQKIRFIPTYEGKESASDKEKKSKAMDKQVLEDLKSLGYIR